MNKKQRTLKTNTSNQLRISDDKLCSTAQIRPQGAEKQLSKVNVVVGGGCTGP